MPIPQQRDLDKTRARLTEWLATQLSAPEALALSDLIAPGGTGFSNDTLLFDATWTEAGAAREQHFVARIQPVGYSVFPDLDVTRQHRVMEHVAAASSDVPLPPIYWLEPDAEVLGAPFFLMGRIDGEIPSDNPPYTIEGFLVEATPAQRERLWWSGIEAMARVHAIDWQAAGLDFLLRREHGPPGLDEQLGYWRAFLDWAARGRPQPIAEATWEWLLEHRPPATAERVGLCWGDARPSNQIFHDFRCVAVLDWEMATIGDPIMDLAWWFFLDRHFSEALGVDRLEGFPSHAETVARYQALTGRNVDPELVEWYEVFAGFRFAGIMTRITQMLIEWEVLPSDSDMETNNLVTQLLASMLHLPSPGEPIRME